MSKAQAVDVALPIGADPERVDNWETYAGVTSRLVWSVPDPLPKNVMDCDVRIVASQRTDGSIVGHDEADCPVIYINGEDYTATQARLLACALIEAADLADKWVTR